MNNVLAMFKGDLKRLTRNPITVIVVLALVILPSIFSWFNLLACWDVFNNTGHLKVAVANSDEGYESDLVQIKVNVGDRVVGALRENDQLDWVFTDEEDAVDGVRAGRYYAAVVIPQSFSRDMMSFYSEDMEHAKITYYSNEKKSAIAPKITDQGADQISVKVNQAFADTISEIALGLAQSMIGYLDSSGAANGVAALADHIVRAGEEMSDFASLLREWSSLLGVAQSLIADAESLVDQVAAEAAATGQYIAQIDVSLQDISNVASSSASSLTAALQACAEGFSTLPAAIDSAVYASASTAENAAALIRDPAAKIDAQAQKLLTVRNTIANIEQRLAEEGIPTSGKLVELLDQALAKLSQLSASLYAAADKLDGAAADARTACEDAKRLAREAAASVQLAKDEYERTLAPLIDELSAKAASVRSTLGQASSVLGNVGYELDTAAGSVSEGIARARGELDAAATDIDASAVRLITIGNDVSAALGSNDLQTALSLLSSNPEDLATAFTTPVKLERHAIFEAQNFGSAMAPLYTTLALWIGALLLMVTISVLPSRRTREELGDLTPRQAFLGRFGLIGGLSLMQSTLLSVGNLLFLGVQAAHPFLYLLCFWVSGLAFAFIIYTLVVLLGNLGKALGVILLVVQVSGGGGSFPLQLLPGFFQAVSPWLPITHSINAMRAAMFGMYGGDFWIELGMLVLFTVPLLIAGIVFAAPFQKVVGGFVEKVEDSKLM